VSADIRVASLEPRHRPRIESIVRATGVFSEDEVAVALELFDSVFGDRLPAPGNSAENRPPTAERPDYEFIGAFLGDEPVGYACFGATPGTDRTWDLYWIAVHPDAQRTGAGAALMSEVERRLDERRARLLVIETSSRDDYAPTRRFYQKRGYMEAARLRDFYDQGDDRVVLTRRFPPGPGLASPGSSPQPASRI
jgi:ribosomal protein S18 acetylase RimI-like enzyme